MHASRPDIVARLKRADGHLRSVITRIEEGRPCVELAQQLHAVEAAICKAKHALIHDHIEHCLEQGNVPEVQSAIGELKLLTKYL